MRKAIIYLFISCVIVASWQKLGDANFNFRILFSTPLDILQYFHNNLVNLAIAGGTTFAESFLGLILATAFSFMTMIFCLIYPKLLNFIVPIFISSQVVPVIAFAPLLIMVFGLGINGKIIMAAVMCFFPLFMNFHSGVNMIPKNIKELIFVYSATHKFKIFKIYFPLSLPSIFTGLKISATLSVIGAIVAEFNGADYGIGKNLFLSAKRLEPELLMTSLIVSILLGGFMYLLVWLIERGLGKWYLE